MATEQMREYFKPAVDRVPRMVDVHGEYRALLVFVPVPPVPMPATLSAAEVGAGRSEK